MAIEKLKEAHEELENVNLSLLVQQGPRDKDEFFSPCLTCLEREKIESSIESTKGNETITSREQLFYGVPKIALLAWRPDASNMAPVITYIAGACNLR